ncbi:S24 family peptidase [Serratia sp. CY76391]|uniref:S24 family peptidase n=1 Tax=Serratia sp. CY76391 TaxID=3383681 RepID=UPI003FA08DEA
MVKKDVLKEEFSQRLTSACLEAGVGGRGLPGRMRTALKKQGISITEPGIWKWLNSAAIPDSTNILALSRWLGIRAEWLEYGRGAMREGDQSPKVIEFSDEIFKIDALPLPNAEELNNYDLVESVHSVEYVKDEAMSMFGNKHSGDIKLINVGGDSMSGTLDPGDLLFIDTTHNEFNGDGIYVFAYDNAIHLKRLQKIKDKFLALSDNKSYNQWEPLSQDEVKEFRFFGKIIGSIPQKYQRYR